MTASPMSIIKGNVVQGPMTYKQQIMHDPKFFVDERNNGYKNAPEGLGKKLRGGDLKPSASNLPEIGPTKDDRSILQTKTGKGLAFGALATVAGGFLVQQGVTVHGQDLSNQLGKEQTDNNLKGEENGQEATKVATMHQADTSKDAQEHQANKSTESSLAQSEEQAKASKNMTGAVKYQAEQNTNQMALTTSGKNGISSQDLSQTLTPSGSNTTTPSSSTTSTPSSSKSSTPSSSISSTPAEGDGPLSQATLPSVSSFATA